MAFCVSPTFEQIPQPIHNDSEMCAILDSGVTSIHNFPITYGEGEIQSSLITQTKLQTVHTRN